MLGWSETKISRLLTGQLAVKEVDVSAIMARDLDTQGWLQQYGSGLPEQLKTLINHEAQATRITEFEELRIPVEFAVIGPWSTSKARRRN